MGKSLMRFVMVPGIGNSVVGHWQSIWQTRWGVDASRISSQSGVGEWSQGQTLLSVFLAMATR